MTALPVVETEQCEITAYVPTNLISITDGQLCLDGDLFAAGFRPGQRTSLARYRASAARPNIPGSRRRPSA